MMNKEINKNTPNPKQSMRRRQRGNTLVPIVIGLAIASIATVAFLNQGATLQTQNNVQLAMSEINTIVSEYTMARSMGTNLADIGVNQVSRIGQENPFGNTVTLAVEANSAGVRVLTYPTDSAASCTTLDGLFPPSGRLRASACDTNTTENLLLTFN